MGKTKDDKELICRMIGILDKVREALVLMRDYDYSTNEAIKDSGIDYATFRRVVFDQKWQSSDKNEKISAKREDLKAIFSNAIPTMHWTEDLFCALVGLRRHPDSCMKMPKDVRLTIETVVNGLKDNERSVIYGIYREKLTLNEVGEAMGITAERVRQIRQAAFRKMQHPNRLCYIVYGDEYYMDQKRAYEKYSKEYEIQARNEEINLLDKIIRERKEFLRRTNPKNYKRMLEKMEISELRLGVRAYNCLSRRGIETISELCSLTHEELRGINNMGQKTYEEVLDVLSEHGLHLAD